jgi:sugar diacid utilization regulator
VYLRDDETGLFSGRVGRQIGRNIDAEVQRLVAGTLADKFTQEIVETKQPVLVRDALHDPRPIHATMRKWNVRAMLGVPMLASESVVGICYLDNEDEPHPFTAGQVAVAATFANLAAIAIVQAQLSKRRRAALEIVARQNELLTRARQIDEQLTLLVLEEADLAQIASVVSQLTEKPCVLYDAACRRLAESAQGQQWIAATLFDEGAHAARPIHEAVASLADKRASVLGPFPAYNLNHRFLVAPIVVRSDLWGYLVLIEQTRRFGPLDPVIASHAAVIVALELAAARRAAAARGEALESFTIDLLRDVHDETRLIQRATFLGLRLTSHQVLALIDGSNASAEGSQSARVVLEAFKAVDPSVQVLTTAVAEGVVAIIEVPPGEPPASAVAGAKQLVDDVGRRLRDAGNVTAALSTICRSPSEIPHAYEEARRVMSMIKMLAVREQSTILAVDDLGVGRLLLSVTDRNELSRYVQDVLGGLLQQDDARITDLMTTVQCFFDCSCSIRATAQRLDVHENTVRYRFASVKNITGLDILSNMQDQLAVQLTLLILRIEGTLPPPVAA